MPDIVSPWDGSGGVEISVDQVVQVFFVAALSFVAITLLAGIIEALTIKRWRRPKYVRMGVYSAACTIMITLIILSVHPLERISHWFLNSLSFLFVFILSELIPIIAIDDVRGAFVRETPLLPEILGVLEGRTGAITYSIRRNSSISGAKVEGLNVIEERVSNVGSSQGVKDDYVKDYSAAENGLRNINVREETLIDPDYEQYSKWSHMNGLILWKLSYGEFSEIRDTVDKVLGEHVFGMSRSKLGIRDLSLLAKIEAREPVEKLRGRYEASFRRLRKLKLVSDRGRLMPRGVRLVKAFKRRGLMKRLREQLP